MVNENFNPLKRWRVSQTPRLTLTECASRAGVSVTCWRSWEAWGEVDGKMPGPVNWVVIGDVTHGAVSANDFVNMIREAA